MNSPLLAILFSCIAFLLYSCGSNPSTPTPIPTPGKPGSGETDPVETPGASGEADTPTQNPNSSSTQDAPNRRKEFSILITPGSAVKNSYVVPVDLFSVTEIGAKSWQNKSAAAYWLDPRPDEKVSFGTKRGARQTSLTIRAPFRAGDEYLVVVAKKAGITRPAIFPLKRKPGSENSDAPLLRINVTAGGITAD